MIAIDCPWCGTRNHDEFTYLGDATVERPGGSDETSDELWIDYVYLRDNPRGEHWEYWLHAAGCRSWLKVRRHTSSHEILSVVTADSRFSASGK